MTAAVEDRSFSFSYEPLPPCCMAAVVDLMECCEAASSPTVRPEEIGEMVLEVTARAALYRWLAHCRQHRRDCSVRPAAA